MCPPAARRQPTRCLSRGGRRYGPSVTVRDDVGRSPSRLRLRALSCDPVVCADAQAAASRDRGGPGPLRIVVYHPPYHLTDGRGWYDPDSMDALYARIGVLRSPRP